MIKVNEAIKNIVNNSLNFGFKTIIVNIIIEIKNLMKFALSPIKKDKIISVITKNIIDNFEKRLDSIKKFSDNKQKVRKKLPTTNSSLKKLAILPG